MYFFISHFMKKGLMIFISLFLFNPAEADETSAVTNAMERLKKNDRLGAIAVITKAIQPTQVIEDGEGSAKDLPAEKLQSLQKLAIRVAEEFLTEEGQRLYELGKSMSAKSPEQAISRLRQSLAKEQESILVSRELASQLIRLGRCKEAVPYVKKSLERIQFDSGSFILLTQAKECFGALDIESLSLESEPSWIPAENPFLEVLRVRSLFRLGKLEEGKHKLDALAANQPQWPEVYYWKWKLDPSGGKINTEYANKYLSLCKSLTPRLNQKFSRYGVNCLFTKEVEARIEQAKSEEAFE